MSVWEFRQWIEESTPMWIFIPLIVTVAIVVLLLPDKKEHYKLKGK